MIVLSVERSRRSIKILYLNWFFGGGRWRKQKQKIFLVTLYGTTLLSSVSELRKFVDVHRLFKLR